MSDIVQSNEIDKEILVNENGLNDADAGEQVTGDDKTANAKKSKKKKPKKPTSKSSHLAC